MPDRPKRFLSFGDQWNIDDQFLKGYDDPATRQKKEWKKKMQALSPLIEETIGTRGWKEVLGPFLDNQLRTEALLNVTDPELRGEKKAFHKFSMLIKNIIALGGMEDKKNDNADEV